MNLKNPKKLEEVKKNLEALIKSSRLITDTFKRLSESDIKHGLFAGAFVSVLTANRVPTDIDIMVAGKDNEKLSKLFEFNSTQGGKVVEGTNISTEGNSYYLGEQEQIEFVSNLVIVVGNVRYPFSVTPLVEKNISKIEISDIAVSLLPVEETIVMKATLQRGIELGKHDMDDIAALLNVVRVNKDYLMERLDEVRADGRIFGALKHFQLV